MHLPQLKQLTNLVESPKKDSYHKIVKNFQHGISTVCMNVLWDAVYSADAARLSNALGFSPYALQTLESGLLLWYVLHKGYLQMAKMLVHAGAQLDVRDPGCPQKYLSFLHFLAARSHDEKYVELALLLLEHGADVDAKDADGKSVLYYAIRCGSLVLVKELLRRDATVFVYGEPVNTSVLALAAGQSNPEEMLELLVYSCEDENARNERAFFVAEYYIDHSMKTEPVKKVLERGLPVDYANRNGWTLLHYAVTGGDVKVVNLLLECGANANLQIRYGAPLHLASFRPRATIPLMLIRSGADIHAPNEDGRYPIHSACYKQSAYTIHLLLQLGADVNVTDYNGQTPFLLMKGDELTLGKTIMIERIALLTSVGRPVNKRDLELIESSDKMRGFFKSCLDELEEMKKRKVVDNVSYYSIVKKDSTQMSSLVRNKEFRETFTNNIQPIAEWFPIYSAQMSNIVEIARRKRELLHFTEMTLNDSFRGTMPYFVIEKISFFICRDLLRDVERDYYLIVHKIIDGKLDLAELRELDELLRF